LPSGTNSARLEFKLNYMAEFQEYVNELKKKIPNLVICGDYNICHEAIDIHNPVANKNSSGFLPVEREWIGNFIDSGFIDSFRHLNKEPHNYTWWSYRANARNNNKGWRIDYHMVSQSLQENIKRAVILPDAKHSDHCPLMVELEFLRRQES
jgi:exodeoxyribonuclease-3